MTPVVSINLPEPQEVTVADEDFASHAWILKGMSGSIAGWLALYEDRLCFATPDEMIFDVPRSEVGSVNFPWYYFGGA